jgi:hypothetical protein
MTIADHNNAEDENQSDTENFRNSRDRVSEPFLNSNSISRQSEMTQSQLSGKISQRRKRERKIVITENEDEYINENEYDDNE